ncbi:hypothetical protein [Paenibacillus xylaniclasticus]|uniref:hypothetical protein n=1 Tax=Paenibacillus xylaniclasticus TaxID=588083 RepID=UPI000FDAA9F4|nr:MULTISPECIES: hypothetical protein [Paenibacillus]GFN32476.1 hypothetical protein PCURB6_27360 [Paenibacillus curdlanolyticus]
MGRTHFDPVSIGYKKFNLSTKQHNILFKNRKKKIFEKYEYYYNDREVILRRFINWLGIIYLVLLAPVYLIMKGLENIPELLIEYKHLFNQKKYGNFSSDCVSANSQLYGDIMYAIKLNSR